jgi:hypothetical protein
MKTSSRSLLVSWVLNTMLLSGCLAQSAAFLPQVAEADRAVVSDWIIGARLVLTGSNASALSQSISHAKGPPSGLHLGTSCSAEFYRGRKLLGLIFFEDGYFETNAAQFVNDGSGALSALQKRLEHDKNAQTNWTRVLVQTAQEVDQGDLHTWRAHVLEAEQTKHAISQASERREGQREISIPFSRPPNEFGIVAKALRIPEPDVSVLVDSHKQSDLLLVSWGHQYGFLVGPTNGYVAVFHAEQITNFAPGVCAFHRGNDYYK